MVPFTEPRLSCTGPYQQYIAALSDSIPGLRTADPNNLTGDAPLMTPGGARVVMLDASAIGRPQFKTRKFRDDRKLKEHLDSSSRDHGRRRIYIMEGLGTDFVAAIGGHFWMDPTFWLRQERSCIWSNDFTPVSDALPPPSLIDPDTTFHVQYCELREFNKALESIPCFCARTRRHVGMTAPRQFTPKARGKGQDMLKSRNDATGEATGNTTTAILRRKASWWCEKNATAGGWDGKSALSKLPHSQANQILVVILCDPQLSKMDNYPKERVYNSRTKGYDLRDIEDINKLENKPFQGGYVDFVPSERLQPGILPSKARHPHKSMLDDLVYYYEHNAHLLDEEEWNVPSNSAVFLKKIVAVHYLQLADYIKAMLPSLELKLTTAWVEEQEQWKALGTISRRCGNYRDDIEDALLSLGYPLEMPAREGRQGNRTRNWKDCEIDYQYAYLRLKVLKQRADNLMTSMTGLASIAGNRQNLEEAKRVKRLNLLALLFIPLAYTSSLFSMQDEYAPNKPQFWVYWVCAIGVVMFTSVVTWVLDQALNDAAEWSWESFKILPIWRTDNNRPRLNRAKTLYG